MPGRDGTGPQGQGPMTGRGYGVAELKKQGTRGENQGQGRGLGLGRGGEPRGGRGQGSGRGRGMR